MSLLNVDTLNTLQVVCLEFSMLVLNGVNDAMVVISYPFDPSDDILCAIDDVVIVDASNHLLGTFGLNLNPIQLNQRYQNHSQQSLMLMNPVKKSVMMFESYYVHVIQMMQVHALLPAVMELMKLSFPKKRAFDLPTDVCKKKGQNKKKFY